MVIIMVCAAAPGSIWRFALTMMRRQGLLGLWVCQEIYAGSHNKLTSFRPVIVAENMLGCAMYELVRLCMLYEYEVPMLILRSAELVMTISLVRSLG